MALKDLIDKGIDKGRKLVEDRGGPDELKRHANELKSIARRPGGAREKLKDAAGVVKGAASASRPEPAAGGGASDPRTPPPGKHDSGVHHNIHDTRPQGGGPTWDDDPARGPSGS